MICTIFKNINTLVNEPHYINVDAALKRISEGKSKQKVEEIRNTIDKEKRQTLKKFLPCVCFSGKFLKGRKDTDLIEHSGFIVLDFDNIDDLRNKQNDLINNDFVYACWVSPSGNGLKALIRIADGRKHREHFAALKEMFPEIDNSGANQSRVCYESYDPDIYTCPDAEIFNKVVEVEKIYTKERVSDNDEEIFKKLLTWLSNKNEAFVSGERNNFIFKLSAACCKFGIEQYSTENLIQHEFLSNSDFSRGEAKRAIYSAYKTNKNRFGDSCFEKGIFVEKINHKEVQIDVAIFDPDIRPKDVIYGIDVKKEALKIYHEGYPELKGIHVQSLDYHFKPKKGEITLLTGIGNYGKSQFKKWYQVMRIILYGEKFATFSPEDNPPEEYYHDFVEILLGCDCTKNNPLRPSEEVYERAYDFISKHIFYVYPKDISPTPAYIKQIFLELIIKEKVDGVDIDPFNQLANDYEKNGVRTDKYLETFLSDCSRFAQINNVYFWIIAHPKGLQMHGANDYPCPNVFDVADGAMWNNKMDNILVYHRPFFISDPTSPICEFHSKKIRRQKVVGKRGSTTFGMSFKDRRYKFEEIDPVRNILFEKEMSFYSDIKPEIIETVFKNEYLESLDESELPF